ncbi:MAG: 3-deoxy-7-phosphoheptulonate synthase [Deltaproteobacteria bacterium]|nr:3-deoxy-7-phosphoheptulonate synthase [Deltaproteobacteria bacterium]
MVVVMKKNADENQISRVLFKIESLGSKAHLSRGNIRTIIGVVGDNSNIEPGVFESLDGVERVVPLLGPFKLASRDFRKENSSFSIDGSHIGGKKIIVMAGPCAVESREQLIESALAVKKAGALALRGGAFKPRTSPYSFQGLGEEGLKILAEARDMVGIAIVTEVIAPEQVPLVAQYADVLQIGARNMQNYALLNAAGESHKPVLLKRGLSSTIEEFLNAAEYILSHNNPRVILCERGIRTFETYTRNTLDINAIPVLKSLSHLPVVVDPSHGTGKREYVAAVSRAAVAAGADGLIVEVHPDPENALSDGAQSLRPEEFDALMAELKPVAEAVGRYI